MIKVDQFQPGDLVIYKMTKQSSHPTPRALTVNPSSKGETYSYIVEKFWVVREVLDDGMLLVQTRRGKVREISQTDPSLKRASWFDRWYYRSRFPDFDSNRARDESEQNTTVS